MLGFEWPANMTEQRRKVFAQILWTLHYEGPFHDADGGATGRLNAALAKRGVKINQSYLNITMKDIDEEHGRIGKFVHRETKGRLMLGIWLAVDPFAVPFPDDPFGPPKTKKAKEQPAVEQIEPGSAGIDLVSGEPIPMDRPEEPTPKTTKMELEPIPHVEDDLEGHEDDESVHDLMLFAASLCMKAANLVVQQPAVHIGQAINDQLRDLGKVFDEMNRLRDELAETQKKLATVTAQRDAYARNVAVYERMFAERE